MTGSIIHLACWAAMELPSEPPEAAPFVPVEDLPPKLEALVAGGLLAFILLLVMAFNGQEMVLPTAFIILVVSAFVALPMMWGRIMPRALRPHDHMWQFLKGGVRVQTGRLTAREAMIQLLAMPLLIFVLALAFVAISVVI